MLLDAVWDMAAYGRKQPLSTYKPRATSSSFLRASAIYLLGSTGDICYTPTTQIEKRLRNFSLSR